MATKLTDADLKEMRDRFQRAAEAEEAQRKSILKCKEFRALNQWPDAIRTAREGGASIAGQAAQPPRPCLTIDRVSQPVQQVSNSIRNANFMVDYAPNGDGADQDTARILKGLWRKVQNDARDQAPIDWAADQAAEGGIGWFRMRSDYCDEDTDDQEVVLERIANNLSVYADPQAVTPTKRDMQWAFVTESIAKDDAKRKWKLSETDLQGLEDFAATGDNQKQWVTKDSLRVVEYYCLEYETDELWRDKSGQIVKKSTLPEDADPEAMGMTFRRTVQKPKVYWQKALATKVVEEGSWAGSRIPLYPIVGKEINVDGRQVYMGVIQPAIGPQEMVNYSYSAAVEVAALGNKSPILAVADAVAPYKQIWQTANVVNHAYLPYDAFDSQQRPLPQPQKFQSEAPIQAYSQLLSMSENAVTATTAFDPALGQAQASGRSGEAVRALQKQQELGQSHWLDNTSRTLLAAGEDFMEVAPVYYDRPGRVLHIAGIDDKPEQVMIGQPFVKPQGSEVPQAATVPGPNGQPMPMPPDHPSIQQGLVQFYDLTKGKYAVTVQVGKGTATRRQEGIEGGLRLAELLPPEQVAKISYLIVKNMDFPDAQDMSDALAPPEALMKGLPPAIAQHVQQLAAENAQLKQVIQSKQAEKQVETVADKQMTLADNATKLEIAKIDAQTKLAVAELNAKSKADIAEVTQRVRILEAMIGVEHEQRMAEAAHAQSGAVHGREHAHDLITAVHQSAHERALEAQKHAQALEQAQQGHEQALEQGQQAAALAPEPAPAASGA